MKLICSGLDLSDAVNKVNKALPQKITNPILEGIKIIAKNDTLTLFATDLELSIEKTIKADVVTEGEFVVPGKVFGEYIKKLSNEQIEIVLNDNNQLVIRYMDSEGVIACYNIDEYPTQSIANNASHFEIDQSDFKDMINKVIFSVSSDDSRPILKGALLEIEDYTITTVALDGFRLALCKKAVEQKVDKMKAIVPARSLKELSNLLGDNPEIITCYIEDSYLRVETKDIKLSTRLLSGDFLNYKQIIPSEFTTNMVVNKEQFDEALDRASILSRVDKNNLVKLDIKENILCLTSTSELGNITENLTISLKGKDLTIAFNARYLNDCMKVLDNEFIKVNFTSSVAPCVLTPCETDEFLYLILPVRMIN
ncbi:MAG: DNA polymerase III subunit beta [Clostridia bacterium]